MKAKLRALATEPLVVFFALAAAIFAVHGASPAADDRPIVVRRADVHRAQVARLGRAPTEDELSAAVERAAEEAALVREAHRLELATDDPIVRRRLAQKMELLAEDLATLEPPTDAELQAHLRSHPEAYAAPARRTVRHVFFPEAGPALDAASAALRGGAAPEALGRPFAAGRVFAGRTERALGTVLSAPVARAAFVAEPDAWVGPVKSPFGWHLVRVERVWSPAPPVLERVRSAVTRDVERARREAAREAVRRKARSRYEVEVKP